MKMSLFQGSLNNVDLVKECIERGNIQIVVHLVSTLIPDSSYEDHKREYKNVIFPINRVDGTVCQQGYRI